MSLVCVGCCLFVFFFKQKTAYEMRISDWSSDVCSSDLAARVRRRGTADRCRRRGGGARHRHFHALANPARDARRLSSGHMSARLPSGIVVGALLRRVNDSRGHGRELATAAAPGGASPLLSADNAATPPLRETSPLFDRAGSG